MKKLALSLLVVLCVLDAERASADVVTITSSGTWSADSSTTDLCAPNVAWTLTLTVNSPLPNFPGGTEFDAPVVSGSYQLGTTAGSLTPSVVKFYSSDNSGGFTVGFGNTDSALAVFDAQTTQFFDGNTLALIPGTYQSQTIDAFADNGFGDSTADIAVGGAVPEPSTWSSLALGVVGIGLLTLRAHRTRSLERVA